MSIEEVVKNMISAQRKLDKEFRADIYSQEYTYKVKQAKIAKEYAKNMKELGIEIPGYLPCISNPLADVELADPNEMTFYKFYNTVHHVQCAVYELMRAADGDADKLKVIRDSWIEYSTPILADINQKLGIG